MLRRCRSPGAARSMLAAERALELISAPAAMIASVAIRIPGAYLFMCPFHDRETAPPWALDAGSFLHESAKARKIHRSRHKARRPVHRAFECDGFPAWWCIRQ